MKAISFKEINALVAGSMHGNLAEGFTSIVQIAIDSRAVIHPSQCLFVSIVGERHNGHDYVEQLYRRGVRFFVVSQLPSLESYQQAVFIQVNDTLQALQILAASYRDMFEYPVLAITGSNGKTIIKEWLYSLLHSSMKIIRSPRSYNSQVGVPLSIFNMNVEHEFGIIEAGISQVGEMQKLQRIIQPTYGIVSNIGEAHQKNFASLHEKINEKLALFDSCKQLVYCADHEELACAVKAKFDEMNCFSWSKHADNTQANLVIDYCNEGQATRLKYRYAHGNGEVLLPFTDAASLENASHCLAFILMKGWENEQVLQAFSQLQPVAMRLEIKAGIHGCQLINDYYNSDLNSLEIALQFQAHHASGQAQQTALILSDIEQAEYADEELALKLIKLLSPFGLNRLILVGKQWCSLQEHFDHSTLFYASTADFLAKFSPDDYQNLNILIKGARDFHFENIAAVLQKKYHQTQLEINLNALIENLNRYKALLKPSTKMMIMVKAFSYGSGSSEIARALSYQQVDYLAVAVADEGLELRRAGVETPIIVMNPEQHSFDMMLENRLEPNLYSVSLFKSFELVAKRMAVRHFPVHLKLETGMHRLGFDDEVALQAVLQAIDSDDTLRVASCFTHLAVSDMPQEDAYTHQQHARFVQLSELVKKYQPNAMQHILNSAGIERFPQYQHDMVRLGVGIYGLAQSDAVKTEVVSRWISLVSQVKTVQAGSTIGYGRRGKADQTKTIAIIPVGYADGYRRSLSNGVGKVWIEGACYPVIGNVCMDMCMVDITGSTIQAGAQVELMGEHITMQQLAEWMGTIPYEVLTGISQRVHRVYVQE
ncbi:MAG: bifunctional UDP-N-acetylmuramoyl-tripeptide:D-alanyl-D-alanine ligase/alanine racemase [Mangrovibacterium sp.]